MARRAQASRSPAAVAIAQMKPYLYDDVRELLVRREKYTVVAVVDHDPSLSSKCMWMLAAASSRFSSEMSSWRV